MNTETHKFTSISTGQSKDQTVKAVQPGFKSKAIEQGSTGWLLNKIQMEGIEQAVYGTGMYILTVFNITKA